MCGKRIRVQKRGRGGSQYRAPRKGRISPTKYPPLPLLETHTGTVTRILHERARETPIAQIEFEDGRMTYINAVTRLTMGSRIQIGRDASIQPGNIVPLEKIPEGTVVCNIEKNINDGGSLVRSSGTSAILSAQTPSGAVVRLPSGKTTVLNGSCRATIGVMAGGGRLEKPFLKAGTRHHALKAKGKIYPRVRGVAMGAHRHPFGGGRHQSPHKSTAVSRYAPPGRKVGMIAARKTGRGRRK